MDNAAETTIPVTLIGKTFSIKCTINQVQALEESVQFLQQRLSAMRDPNTDANLERLLVITALNLVNEILHTDEEASPNIVAINQRISSLAHKIELQLTSMEDIDS